jgi:hypothetical protein
MTMDWRRSTQIKRIDIWIIPLLTHLISLVTSH